VNPKRHKHKLPVGAYCVVTNWITLSSSGSLRPGTIVQVESEVLYGGEVAGWFVLCRFPDGRLGNLSLNSLKEVSDLDAVTTALGGASDG